MIPLPFLRISSLLLFSTFMVLLMDVFAQPEVQPWGNLRGIRVEGQLIRFESSFRVVGNRWDQERATARERNWTMYRREGTHQIVHTRMDSLFFTETVSSREPGTAQLEISFDPRRDTMLTGAFFHIALPAHTFANAQIKLLEPAAIDLEVHKPGTVNPHEIMRMPAKGIRLEAESQQIQIRADQPTDLLVVSDPVTQDLGIYFTLKAGNVQKGQPSTHRFDIEVSGLPDTRTAHLKLYPDYPGNAFLGLGGNFRLQNARTDPQVIDYCLENLDVRMGRVEMPWSFWHPYDSINPLEAARRGDIPPRVKAAMEMAQRLHKMGMPVLLAAWFPPGWAAEGTVSRNPRNPDGTFGNPLRQDRANEIYESLTSYIVYLKEAYGVEVSMFSFNESDLGINVRQTAEEHARLIRELGAHMRAKGLKTKLLLGDTADANGFEFVNVALDDPETWPYIGAVSFHSWRGWEKETLLEWFEAADRIDVPLIIGEGSIDAAAWRYNQIFTEPHYAMEEIKLYTRILAICQPQSILQWQLTADYSPLSGGGIFGNDSTALQPTQRFWNLKQLSHTPPGLYAMPLTSDNEELFVAALGDTGRGEFAFHLVNDGPAREVVLSGLPDQLKRLRLYVTDHQRAVEKGDRIRVKNGEARFRINAASFTTLMSE